MNTPIEYQIIKDGSGNPAFVVIPYASWLKQSSRSAGMIPNEVVSAVIEEEKTIVRAWREFLGLTQVELAEKAGISQAALSQIESGEHRIRKATREKLAKALGLIESQLR